MFARVLDVNTLGPLRVAQAVTPHWRERGSGVLVNISSVQGKIGTPLEGAYAASKHALEAISETLHFELGHFGIRVVIIEPGYIAPGMKHQADYPGPAVYTDLHAQWGATATTLTGPGGRPGPELVGAAVADALEDPGTPLRVEVGKDADFGKPKPKYKIQKPPFYAAWSTPILHDCLAGLRINRKCQVMDMKSQVIPGLYCCGESAGGFALHGLPRVTVFGRIAGREAALAKA